MKREIIIGNGSSGISIQYIKSRKVIYIHGWYDHICGMEGKEFPFQEFCEKLGIPLKTGQEKG